MAAITKNLQVGIQVDVAAVRQQLTRLRTEVQSAIKGITTSSAGGAATGDIQQLKTLYDGYGRAIKQVTPELQNLEGATRKVSRAHKENVSDLLHLNQGIKGYIAGVTTLLQIQARWYAAKAVLFAAVEFPVESIKNFAQWEQAMKNAAAVSEYTADEMLKLEVVTKRVGATTAISAKEAAEALLEFAQAGIDATRAQAAIPIAAQMVVATQEDMKTAVSALTTVMQVWKLEAHEVVSAGDAIAVAMAESKLKVADLSTIFNYLASSAQLAGLSVQDVSAVIAVLSKAGAKASTIGTGLSTAMMEFIKMQPRLVKQIEKVGLTIQDVIVPQNNFLDVMIKLKNAGFDLTEAFKGLQMRAGRSLAAGLNMGTEELERMRQKVQENGILFKIFGKAMEGVENQFKLFKNTMENVSIAIGQDMANSIQAALGLFLDMARGIWLAVDPTAQMTIRLQDLGVAGQTTYAAIKGLVDIAHMLRDTFVTLKDTLLAVITPLKTLLGLLNSYGLAAALVGNLIAAKLLVVLAQKILGLGILINLFKTLGPVLVGNAVLLRGWWRALMPTPMGAVVLGLTAILTIFQKLKQPIEEARIELERFGEAAAQMPIDMLRASIEVRKLGIAELKGQLDQITQMPSGLGKSPMTEYTKKEIERLKSLFVPLTESQRQYKKTIVDIQDQTKKLAIEEAKLLELEKQIGKARKEPPPYEPPEDKIKHYYKQMISAYKAYSNDMLAMIRDTEALYLAQVENAHKLGLMDDKSYYDAKIQGIEVYRDQALKQIAETESKLQAAYRLDMKSAKSEAERAAIFEKFKADLSEMEKQRVDVKYKAEKQINDITTQSILNQKQLNTEYAQFLVELAEMISQQQLDVLLDSYKQQLDAIEYYYGKQEISATEYYNKQYELLDKETAAKKLALDTQYENFIKEKYAELEAAGDSTKERAKIEEQMVKATQKYYGDGVKIAQDSANQRVIIERKASDDIQDIWEKSGAFGVITRAVEDINKEWNKTWEDIKKFTDEVFESLKKSFSDIFYDGITGKLDSLADYFKRTGELMLRYFTDNLAKMAVMAIQNPIIVPIQNMVIRQAGNLAGVAGMAGQAGIGYGIGNMLGGGSTGGMAGLIGGMAGFGLATSSLMTSGAMAAFMINAGMVGAVWGSVVPILGTIVGAVLGVLVGQLIGGEPHIPDMRVGYKPGGKGHSEEWKNLFGDTEFAVRMYDKVGVENTKIILETFKTLKEELAKFLEATGGDISKLEEAWKSSSVDVDKDLKKTVQKWIEEYSNFITGLDFSKWQKEGEEMSDTVSRIITTYVKLLPKFNESVDDYIKAIQNGDDAVAQFREQINDVTGNIEELMEAMLDATDPTDAIQYADQLRQAIYQRYQMERQLIEGLVNTIKQLEAEIANFDITMQGKIDDLLGSFDRIPMIWARMVDIATMLADSSLTAAEKLALLSEGIQWLDQWVTANIAAITAVYEAQKNALRQQIDLINDQIDALNEQRDVINEQLDALREQLSLAKTWSDVLDSVKQQILDMKTSLTSPRDVFERMDIMKAEIDRVRGLYLGATGEDKAAYAKQLQQLIRDYLQLTQDAYQRPSEAYQQIYDDMLALLESIQVDASANAVSQEDILQQIADLEEQRKTIDEQIKDYQAQIKDLNEQMAALDEQMAADIAAFKAEAAKYYQWAQEEGIRLYQEKIDELKDKLREIVGDEDIETYLDNLELATIEQLQDLKELTGNLMKGLLEGDTAYLEEIRDTGNDILNTILKWDIPKLASGGYVTKPTLAIVGESGPEHIIPDRDLRSSSTGYHTMTVAPTIIINVNEIKDEQTMRRLTEKVKQAVFDSIHYGEGRTLVKKVTR
uniref:Putative tail protein n=1 Tax=viral metagenome TaxID=1070528 RepID=A0A6H1ZA05_9ZZZZ